DVPGDLQGVRRAQEAAAEADSEGYEKEAPEDRHPHWVLRKSDEPEATDPYPFGTCCVCNSDKMRALSVRRCVQLPLEFWRKYLRLTVVYLRSFEDTYYLEIKGSAMGSNVAPPYANAYMAHYEDTSIYTQDLFHSHALTWKRYIDDVFCVWGGDLRTLQAFFQVLRTSWPGLDFTMTYDTHQISFLDTLVIKDDNGNLSTDLYSKPTDRNSLLHYSSFHPKNMIKSIPKSQLNRVSKIVSDPATKDLRTTEMRSKFRERGYPPRILDTAQANSTTRDRISATSRIPFVHQYHPAAYKLHRTIRQHWHILQEAYPTIQEFQHPFLPCFKRPRNIKDNLVRTDIGPTHSGPTQRFLANPKTGTDEVRTQFVGWHLQTNIPEGEPHFVPRLKGQSIPASLIDMLLHMLQRSL
ncbi:unnamed protein product, partial [Ranitomeya imitator]